MKHAKAVRTGATRHKARATSTRNVREYRVTATWPGNPTATQQHGTPDRARARRTARHYAATGAHVIVEEHTGHGLYRTLYEIDGLAIAAEAEAAEQAAQDAADARIRAALLARAEARRAADRAQRDRAQAAALMVQPPVPRQPAQRGARHTAGRR